MTKACDLLNLLLVQMLLEAMQQTIERHLRSVWYEREYGVGSIVVHSTKDSRSKLLTEFLAFLIYIPVRATAEVYALERAGLNLFWLDAGGNTLQPCLL